MVRLVQTFNSFSFMNLLILTIIPCFGHNCYNFSYFL